MFVPDAAAERAIGANYGPIILMHGKFMRLADVSRD
jgi:hypothetical protein